jgi:hypothetical protein
MNRAEYQGYLSHTLWLECRNRVSASRREGALKPGARCPIATPIENR